MPTEGPVITSVAVNTAALTDGGDVVFTLEVLSEAPLSYVFGWGDGSPDEPYQAGTYGCCFIDLDDHGDGSWTVTFTETLSPFDTSGTWTWGDFVVYDEADRTSDPWPLQYDVVLTNTQVAVAPVINAVDVSTATISEGGDVVFTLDVTSDVPLSYVFGWGHGSPTEPYQAGTYGCCFVHITDEGNGQWTVVYTVTLSPFDASGTWSWGDFVVYNEVDQTSDPWPLQYDVVLTNTQVAVPPVIHSVDVNTAALTGGGDVVFTLDVTSNVPVSSVFGWGEGRPGDPYQAGTYGCCFVDVTDLGGDHWTVVFTETVSAFDPSGTYTWGDFVVYNEVEQTSAPWGMQYDVVVNND